MELKITNADICRVAPSGTTPDMALTEQLRHFFDDACKSLIPLVGIDLLERVANKIDTIDFAETRDEQLWQWCLCYIIAKGYHDAIPHLDLVLTPTGFGVVSNQNVAPASSDRVLRLREQLCNQADYYFVEIRSLLRFFPEWHELVTPYRITSFFWDYRYLSIMGVKDPHMRDFSDVRASIITGEYLCRALIGREFWGELIDAEAHASTTSMQEAVIKLIRNYVGASVEGGKRLALHKDILIDFIHTNIAEFPTYAESSAYKANTFTPYENKKDDSCFFFG